MSNSNKSFSLRIEVREAATAVVYQAEIATGGELAGALRSFADQLDGDGCEPTPAGLLKKTLATKGKRK